jgi:hypothetical protein
MSERKLNKIDGHDPWEIEVAHWVENFKLDPIDARALTVIRWMLNGDLRPLAAALRAGPLDPPVLSQLLRLIDEHRLTVKTGRRGAASPPDKFPRDLAAAIFYQNKISAGIKSDQAVEEVASELGLTSDNVRKICTLFNKNWHWK